MTETCPHCGQDWQISRPELIAKRVESMRAWCAENQHWVSHDDRVYPETAAAILGKSPKTLRNWRTGAGPDIPFRRNAGSKGRATYRLIDLIEYLER